MTASPEHADRRSRHPRALTRALTGAAYTLSFTVTAGATTYAVLKNGAPKSAFVMVPLGVFDIVSQPVKYAARSPSDVIVMSWIVFFIL